MLRPTAVRGPAGCFPRWHRELLAAGLTNTVILAARDNLKRAVIRACRDVFTIIPCGRALDRAWKSASESAAYEYAARKGRNGAELASALVKIARLVPACHLLHTPAAALLIGDEDAEALVSRVRRLTLLASTGLPPETELSLRALGGFLVLGVTMGAATWVSAHSKTLLAFIPLSNRSSPSCNKRGLCRAGT